MTQPPLDVVVVAIAGPSGAGKTTLVKQVGKLLGTTTLLYFDDYADVSSYPTDLPAWLAAGADPSEWRTPRMTADLQALRNGTAIVHPDGTTILHPAPYVVVEEAFGRERQEIAPLIDLVAVIDIPLEIALARRIRRSFSEGRKQWDAEQVLLHVDHYLESYMTLGSTLYGTVNRRAIASGDVIVDGMLPVEQLGVHVAMAVRARFQ